jgi:hypothetical protein
MAGEAAGCRGPGAPCAWPQAPVLSRHQRPGARSSKSSVAWATAWAPPSPAPVSMPPNSLWPVHGGGMAGLLERGHTPAAASHWALATAERQGQGVGGGGGGGGFPFMGWRCDVREWMVRCARAMTRPSTQSLAVPWMRAFEWRWGCMECSLALCGRQICAVWTPTLSARSRGQCRISSLMTR